MQEGAQMNIRLPGFLLHVSAAALLALAGLATGSPACAADPEAGEGPYTSLFVFGDSYSDIGAGYVDGNGPTSVAYLAADLGIPFTYAGAPDAAGKGLDFAVSGAQTGASPGIHFAGVFLGYGMLNQVADFEKLVTSGTVSFDPARTLFFIAGGLNDGNLTNAITVANLTSQFHTLYALGARNFALASLPTLIPAFSAVAARLNPAYSTLVLELEAQLPGSNIYLSRWGSFYDAILTDPARYGFTNITDRCAGRAIFGQDPTPCATPNTYFYYHDSHPSTAAHRVVGNLLYQEALATAGRCKRHSEEAAGETLVPQRAEVANRLRGQDQPIRDTSRWPFGTAGAHCA